MFVLKHTVRLLRVRWKRFAIFLCLTALLCIATGLLGNYLLSQNTVVEPITLLVADEDDSMESRMFFNALTSIELYEGFLTFEKDTLFSAMGRLESGEATAVALIPEGFAQSVMTGENRPVSVWYSSAAPLKSQLVRTYADAFTDLLRTSQIGVYTALEYARENGGADSYQEAFYSSNMGYLTIVAQRGQLFESREISATGQLGVFLYYIVHALVFLLLISPILLLDVMRGTFSPYLLGSLRRMGVGCGCIGAGCGAGFFLLYLGAGGLLLLGYLFLELRYPGVVQLPVQVVPALVVVLAVAAGLALLVCSLFRSTVAGGMLVTAYSLLSLAAAGGIIPSAYLAGWVQAVGMVTPQYWCTRALAAGTKGEFDGAALVAALLWCVLCWGLSVLQLRRRLGTGAVE